MTNRRGVSFSLALIAACAVGAFAAPVRAVDDLSLAVAPASQIVTPGTTFTVQLDLTNLSTAINGVQARMQYDSSVLTLLDIVPTDLGLALPAMGWVEVLQTDVAGIVDYAIVINGGSTFTGGTIATLIFSADAEGPSNISFRLDVAPFETKLTRASDNTTILPNTFDSPVVVSACDDGLFCNGLELFVVGVCVAGTNPCIDGVACTDDSCDDTLDTCANLPNNLNCPDDGLFCTGMEICDATLDCISTGDPCLATEFCNDATDVCDTCVFNSDCNDGVVCTTDLCVSGVCAFVADDTACDDGLFCNGAETCHPTLDCQIAMSPCDDGVACTIDTCDDLLDTCTNTPDDTFCDNALFCDGVETCDATLDCQLGTAPNCADTVGCTVDACDEVNDICTNTPDDTACDNGLFCDGAETCDLLLDCQLGTDPCNDAVGCTVDVCDDLLDTCTNTVDDTLCNNGLFCDGVETCDALLDCQLGMDPCDDAVGCTVDTCDDVLDVCTNTVDDTLCDNALFCDGLETCDALLDCQAGVAPNCTDTVGCTVDACDEVNDICTNTADDTLCDNALFCDGAETCDALLDCQVGIDPCDDGVACTVDTCDDILDTCASVATDALCDNGVFCDGAETCDAVLDCQAATDPCSPLACNEATMMCVSPIHIANLEVFYSGRFLDAEDTSKNVLAAGTTALPANITNYDGGITGIRVTFDNIVTFATTPDAAFIFDWTTGSGSTFSAVTGLALNATVTQAPVAGVTVVTIVFTDNHVRKRWLRVTVDSTQITVGGIALDGELTGNPVLLPSGDGTPGGAAVFHLGNMPGDVDGDRKALLTDVGIIRAAVNPFLAVPITNANDVDHDGKVLLTDVGKARAQVNPFFTLPLITP